MFCIQHRSVCPHDDGILLFAHMMMASKVQQTLADYLYYNGHPKVTLMLMIYLTDQCVCSLQHLVGFCYLSPGGFVGAASLCSFLIVCCSFSIVC